MRCRPFRVRAAAGGGQPTAVIAPSRSPWNRAQRARAASYSDGSIARSKPSSATDASPFALVRLPEALDDARAVHEDGLEHPVEAGHDPRRMERIADVAAIRVPEEVLVEGGEREPA